MTSVDSTVGKFCLNDRQILSLRKPWKQSSQNTEEEKGNFLFQKYLLLNLHF